VSEINPYQGALSKKPRIVCNNSSGLSGRDICHGKPGLKSGLLFLCAFSTRDVHRGQALPWATESDRQI